MKYNIGDAVRLRGSSYCGFITFVSGVYYVVQSQGGFERVFTAGELEAIGKPSKDVKNQ